MSVRAWVLIAAIGLIFFPGSGQAQDEASESQTSEDAGNEQPGGPVFAIPIELIESATEAEARKRSEDEAKRREVADLAAQQGMHLATESMNDATQRMAQYAFWSTLIVGVGTVLLFWTLWETRKATNAAVEATNVTREIGQRQVRAYLSLDSIATMFDLTVANRQNVVFRPTFKNTGASPGTVTFSSVSVGCLVADHRTLTFRFDRANSPVSGMRIGSGGERWFNSDPIGLAALDETIKRGAPPVVCGIVYYRDVFGEDEHKEIYCAVIHFDGPLLGVTNHTLPTHHWVAYSDYEVLVDGEKQRDDHG